jgi:hypothetical protein
MTKTLAILLSATVLVGCAVPRAPEVLLVQGDADELDRVLNDAELCRYPYVRKTFGPEHEAALAITVPRHADARYQCLVASRAARSGDGS